MTDRLVQNMLDERSSVKLDATNRLVPILIYKLSQMKQREIMKAFYMKGGWEGWLQVELTSWLEQNGYAVDREQPVFVDPAQKVDLLVTAPSPASPSGNASDHGVRILVELKCESLFQDITDRREDKVDKPLFAKRIEQDLSKYGAGGSNIRNELGGIFYCCIGISLTFDARDYLLGKSAEFSGLSKDQIAQYAASLGPVDDNPDDNTPFGDYELMMWWSGMHQKA